jgi:preprotein translocase subunit SecY
MSIMIFPGTVASWFQYSSTQWVSDFAHFLQKIFDTSSPLYWVIYFILVVGFTFFYTLVIFQQQRLAENLQKYGGFIPGIRPGRPTDEYLMRVLTRITWAGALFLGVIAVLPFFAQTATNVGSIQLSATGLLIIVGVVLDTMRQLEAQLLMRNYEGFIK